VWGSVVTHFCTFGYFLFYFMSIVAELRQSVVIDSLTDHATVRLHFGFIPWTPLYQIIEESVFILLTASIGNRCRVTRSSRCLLGPMIDVESSSL